MKFVAAVLTLAAVATAAPAELVARTTGGDCNVNGNNDGRVTCCGAGLIGGLLCNVLAIGNTCNSNQETKCCKTDSSVSLVSPGIS